jgi:hypothetical protein
MIFHNAEEALLSNTIIFSIWAFKERITEIYEF